MFRKIKPHSHYRRSSLQMNLHINMEYTEKTIISMTDFLKFNNCRDQTARKILLSNLILYKENDIILPPSVIKLLTEFMLHCLENMEDLVSIPDNEFSEISIILNLIHYFQANNCSFISETVLCNVIKEVVAKMKLLDATEGGNITRIMKYLSVIEMIVGNCRLDSKNSSTIEQPLEDLITNALTSNNKTLITYSLSLLITFYRKENRSELIGRIWLNIIQKALYGDQFAQTYLIITAYLIDSSIERNEIVQILNTKEFWIVLQKCFQNEACCQKYVLNILKFAVFNLCDDANCMKRHCSVWDCRSSEKYQLWWKTYFIIVESLKEKQTHLVLPIFSLISKLINDRLVDNSSFWILKLIENGLEHDSRTVRLRSFFCLFDSGVELFDGDSLARTMKMFTNAANDSALYRKMEKAEEFDNFRNKFVVWLTILATHENKDNLLELLLQNLCERKWSPIPLYYVLVFISESKITRSMRVSQAKMFGNLVLFVTRLHNIAIRGAIQCLIIKLLTQFYKCDSGTLNDFLILLNHFNEDECFLRNVHSWCDVVNYLRNCVCFHEAENYVLTRIRTQIECDKRSSNKAVYILARDTMILHDAFDLFEKSVEIRDYFLKMITSFSSTSQKPYLNTRLQDNYLKLLVHLFGISQNNNKIKICDRGSIVNVVTIINENSTYIFSYIVDRMMKLENDVELLELYDFCLNELFECIPEFLKDKNSTFLINEWLRKSFINCNTHRAESALCSMKIILWICKFTLSSRLKLVHCQNLDYIKCIIINSFEDKQRSFLRSIGDIHDNVSNYTNLFWNLIEICSKTKFCMLAECVEIQTIFEVIFDTLNWIKQENLAHILKALRFLCFNGNILKHEELMARLMDEIWKRIEEIKSTSFYCICLEYWIQIFWHRSFFGCKIYHPKITRYIDELLQKVSEDGGQSYGYIILVLKGFAKIDDIFDIYPAIPNFLIRTFCVTHINRKDQRSEKATMDHIRSLNSSISVNQIVKFDGSYSSEEVRLMALDLMLQLNRDEEKLINHCLKFVELLTITDDSAKKRYFNDSLFHRMKHKKLQVLLIFETILFQKVSLFRLNVVEYTSRIYNFIVNCLLVEPHQPSVRYMLEWILIRLVVHYPSYFEHKFWDSFSQASEERIGSVCSFISVTFHLANIFQREIFLDQAVKVILPWTMVQHFNARLYAQSVLVYLINMNNKIMDRYDTVLKSLDCCLKKGNAVKNSLKLQQDFYFSSFRPMDHFSLETVLWDIPRLSNISPEEWISGKLYKRYISLESKCIPIFNSLHTLSHFTSASWITKATETSREYEKKIYSETESFNFDVIEMQKKFVPSETSICSIKSNVSNKSSYNLIVVASLIDKAPNLGGLTRTCEVFAVSTLVVHDRNIIRNKEFISLSITAEKHLPVVEVKKQYLFDYLKKMKEKQFCIVGAEQTTNSKNLSDFVFPSKSVILLGNEKEGIPASLLSVLDVCIEIPQMGVIRSLNVHVSASLLLWEYAKQHVFKDTRSEINLIEKTSSK